MVVGAHLDSVDTPGANDNGSGLAALMEIARIVKEIRLPVEVRCMAFGAEEIGLRGSEKAAEAISAESSRCVGMINLDTIGQGEAITIYTLPGTSHAFAELAGRTADRLGIAWSSAVSLASDHAPFARLGIPAVFLMREPAVFYHTDADTIASVDPAVIGEAVRLAVGIISILE